MKARTPGVNQSKKCAISRHDSARGGKGSLSFRVRCRRARFSLRQEERDKNGIHARGAAKEDDALQD